MQLLGPVALTRQDLGICLDTVQPLGLSGPMVQGHLMTIEIRGADLTLSQALKTNRHGVPSYYDSNVGNTIPVYSNRVRIHCKAGSVSARLVSETRAKCQDFVARYKDDGISFEIDSPFCCAKTTISLRQSKSIEDWEIGKQFAPLWKALAEKLEVLFPDGDDEGAFIVPALDARSQVLSIKDRRNGVGKPVFKLALWEADSCLLLLHLTCVFLVFLLKCCNGSSLMPARPMCDGRPFASPLFRRLAGGGAFFQLFVVSMGSTLCVIFDSQHNRACCYALLQGGSTI